VHGVSSCDQPVKSSDVKKLIVVVCGWCVWFDLYRGFVVEGLNGGAIDTICGAQVTRLSQRGERNEMAHQNPKLME
jgi:hypothetical protein